MKYFYSLVASAALAALGNAQVSNQIVVITNVPPITKFPTNQLVRPTGHMNQLPGVTNGLHDVIGTNGPKDRMSRPTLTNQPIKIVPLQ